MMDPMTAVRSVVVENYANFTGRARRSEYWWFFLAFVIVAIITQLISVWLYLIVALALLAPGLAVGFRRLQDTGKPGWYILIPFGLSLIGLLITPDVDPTGTTVPNMGALALAGLFGLVQLVVAILFIWWLTRPSEEGSNTWGPPPA
ncbi:MAG: DUF805 domain-containing protein [Pseudomonadota bacterium]